MRFTVHGRPAPQGSMRGFVRNGRAVLASDNPKMRPWRNDVALTAMTARPEIIDGPVSIELDFYLARPKSAPRARLCPTVKPDLDKLIRAILDALKGICWNDDSQVCEVTARKHYGSPERAEINVRAG